MGNMMQISRAPSMFFVLWYLRLWEQLMSKVKKFSVNYFASLLNVLVVNLLLIVVGHGLESRVIYSDLLRNLFLIVLMAASSLTM